MNASTQQHDENHADGRSGSNDGLCVELERQLRAAINPLYEDVIGTESFERKRLLGEIDRLREALRISTNGLRHCSRWNISEETEKAIITQVIANEALLPPNA